MLFHQLLCCWLPWLQDDPFRGGALALKQRTISLRRDLGCAPLPTSYLTVAQDHVLGSHAGTSCCTLWKGTLLHHRRQSSALASALRGSSSPQYKSLASSSREKKNLSSLWESSQHSCPVSVKDSLKATGQSPAALQHLCLDQEIPNSARPPDFSFQPQQLSSQCLI